VATANVILRWSETRTDRSHDEHLTLTGLPDELNEGATFDEGGWEWRAVKRVSARDYGFRALPEAWAFVCEPVRSLPAPAAD
jgi:hypothetical protein